MLSVIIPTMWFHRDNLIQIVDSLTKQSIIGEIIVVHNNKIDYDLNVLNQDKLTSVIPPRNIGCNPAWNLGAKLSKFDKLLILNDDFNFDFSICEKVAPHITIDKGLILSGTNSSNLDTPVRLSPSNWPSSWIHGWACAFFVHKTVYLDNLIPEEIKVYCGDNWLLDTIGKPHYVLRGITFSNNFTITINRLPELSTNKFLGIDFSADIPLYDSLKQKHAKYAEYESLEEIIL